MRFESFHYFRLLTVLLLLVGVWVWSQYMFRRRLHESIGPRTSPFLMASLSKNKRLAKRILQILFLSLLVIALARPQMGQSKQEVRSEGVEIIFLVDVSESMMTEDVRPSRLEQVKSELGKLLDLMPGNRVGIIAFAGSATLLSPLTSDPNSIRMYIESLSPMSVSTQGTNFQRALFEAMEAFHKGGVGKQATRAILLLSDGEDQEKGAMDQAQQLANEGIRIFALAYGTERGGAVPDRDSMGFLRGYKKDSTGKTVLSQVHGAALRELASLGKGSFYHASPGGDHLSKLVEDINNLEKMGFDSQLVTQYDEKFQWILGIALLVAVVELLLDERRKKFRLWRGRFEVPPS